jgi:hypothetical protein
MVRDMLTALLLPFTFGEILVFLVLLIIGIIIIVILKALIHFILPIIAALVIWFVTHSLTYAGLAFLIIAILQLIVRRR